MNEVPDAPAARRNFVPDDPTEDPNFDPSKWTGTIMSGLIRMTSECSQCEDEWTDGHQCGLHRCPRCGQSITIDPNPAVDWLRHWSWQLAHKLNCK